MPGLKLVNDGKEAAANIQRFKHELSFSPGLQRLLSRSPVWYAVRFDGTFALAPSKFVGYRDNNGPNYLANTGPDGVHDGRETERLLEQWFDDVPSGSALDRQLGAALAALLQSYGKSPNARARFRILRETPEKVAATQQDRNIPAKSREGKNWIVFDPDICAGKPTLRGTRIRVSDIMQLLAGGDTVKQILEDFPSLRQEHVEAALSYAADAVDHRVIRAA
jgi:uncharacterized protein (DUF433 family)